MRSFPVLNIIVCFLANDAMSLIVKNTDQRYLVEKDGKPFFWLGDTNRGTAHCLDQDGTRKFIDTSGKHRFNVLLQVDNTSKGFSSLCKSV